MVQLMKLLDLPISEYSSEKDPTKLLQTGSESIVDWTVPDSSVKIMRMIYERKCCKQSKKRQVNKGTERKDDILDFKQMKRIKPKEDKEQCEDSIYTTCTQNVSVSIKREIVTDSLEGKSNVITAVKDSQENVTDITEYDIKIENDKTGPPQIMLEDSQHVSLNEHLHANVAKVGIIDVQS
jgi:hypothetical protein